MNSNALITMAMTLGLAACEPSAGAMHDQENARPPPQPLAAQDLRADSTAGNTQKTDLIPPEVRNFVPADSTLLAYKKFDLTGDGREDAVIIVRHPVTEPYATYVNNPCDLVILHGGPNGFMKVAESSRVIDCTYKNYNREVAANIYDLNGLIELKTNTIIYTNERDRPSTSTYSFYYSKDKVKWYLGKGENYYHTYDTDKDLQVDVSEVINYPEHIPLIKIEDFDPYYLDQFFSKNRELKYSK